MSRKSKSKLQKFLEQKGYLFVFTLVAGVCLFSYFLANSNFVSKQETNVLGTSSIRGIWVKGVNNDCPEADLVDAKGCIDSSYFDEYTTLLSKDIALDRDGRLVFSNDSILISGIFDVKEVVDDEVWNNLFVGDLNLKINGRQWVFEGVVWDRQNSSAVVSVVDTNDGYLILLYPSVTLTGRTRQFWIFKYLMEDDRLERVYFDKDGKRAFVEATDGEFLSKGDELFLRLDREDPVLLEGREVMLFEYGESLRFLKNFVFKEK